MDKYSGFKDRIVSWFKKPGIYESARQFAENGAKAAESADVAVTRAGKGVYYAGAGIGLGAAGAGIGYGGGKMMNNKQARINSLGFGVSVDKYSEFMAKTAGFLEGAAKSVGNVLSKGNNSAIAGAGIGAVGGYAAADKDNKIQGAISGATAGGLMGHMAKGTVRKAFKAPSSAPNATQTASSSSTITNAAGSMNSGID